MMAYEMRMNDWSSDVCSSDLAQLRRAPDLLEWLMAAQRRFQVAQQATLQSLRDTAQKVEEVGAASSDGVTQAVEAVRATQEALEARMAEIEMFHLRFDRPLSDFDRRIKALRSSADHPLRRAVANVTACVALLEWSAQHNTSRHQRLR